MATTAEYLNKLVEQKNTLADNLVTKGIAATHDETLDTLVPKVLDITSGGGGNGIYPIDETGMPTGDVVVPNGVVTLNLKPFRANTNITSVSLPTSLTSISDNCFENCTSLQSVNIPSGVTDIPNYAFYGCSRLSTINIPSNCSNIGEYAFANCTNLKNITINAQYTYRNYCFSYCKSLTNDDVCKILNNVSIVYSYLFIGCTGITDIKVNIVWHNMFESCTNLVHAIITGSGSSMNTGDAVFRRCTKLQEIYLAPDTKKIGYSIFQYCQSLKIVFLPSTIIETSHDCLTTTNSNYYAFDGCTALEDVQLGQDWNMSLRLNVSNNLTVDSMVAMFNSLKDLTGDTAKTLTLGSTNLAKLTDEQKLIATNKNWTLA